MPTDSILGYANRGIVARMTHYHIPSRALHSKLEASFRKVSDRLNYSEDID